VGLQDELGEGECLVFGPGCERERLPKAGEGADRLGRELGELWRFQVGLGLGAGLHFSEGSSCASL
jgi:hypothetical protein